MDFIWHTEALWNNSFAVLLALLIGAVLSLSVMLQLYSRRHLPPGPIQWPVVGSLLSVGFQSRHRTFARLAEKYGPVMHLRLGAANIIVVSTPELAMEVLKSKDAEWSSRPPSSAGKYIGFDFHSLDFAPNGPHWRHLRKICTTQLFSPARIKMQSNIRKEELMDMVNHIISLTQRGEVINLRSVCDDVVLKIISRMLFGNRYRNPDHPMAKEMQSFMEDVREAMILSDLVPGLDWLDLQGYDRRIKRLNLRLERVYRLIIDDHRHHLRMNQQNATYTQQDSEETMDFIDVLLSFQGQDHLSEKSLMGIMTDVLLFGIDITATGIEWAMAELIQNQRILRKAQEEIDRVVTDSRLVDESDIWQLPYLDCVAKETLRLHPPVPLTDPHYNEEAVELVGYKIPPKFVLFVNIWGLARDPRLWNEPLKFYPERFEAESNINTGINGNDFRFIPFSSGRRKCPAAQMAYLKIKQAVAILLHAFDWSLPEGRQDVDMEEGYGVICPMKVPLLAIAKPRLEFLRLRV
eukprot:Gb_13074 [translate_table: standard]